MERIDGLFFELLQTAVERRDKLSAIPTEQEWQDLYDMSKKQSVLGVASYGLERLPKEQLPERKLLLRWMNNVAKIEQRNKLTTAVSYGLSQFFDKEGFHTCILKGQTNQVNYGEKLKYKRSSGDVDIWITPKDKNCAHPVKYTIDYLTEKNLVVSLCYLHVEMKSVKKVPVEVHFRPSFMNAPSKNRRFLKFFSPIEDCTCKKDIGNDLSLPALKTDYDVIFQMNHVYRHLIDEGVGLRQVLDYYMLLKTWHGQHEFSREKVMEIVGRLGMRRFAGALMYVLKEVFAMPSDWMVCEPSEADGRFLLSEIMLAGNFGHKDPRMATLKVEKGKTSFQISRAYRRFTRNLRFFSSYPEEVVWEPVIRLVHFWWRKFKLWRF